jgi:hypothetical protein
VQRALLHQNHQRGAAADGARIVRRAFAAKRPLPAAIAVEGVRRNESSSLVLKMPLCFYPSVALESRTWKLEH